MQKEKQLMTIEARRKSMIEKDNSITLSRITGMLFIVICHIVKYFWFIPGHNILGDFFDCGVQLFIFISGYLYGMRVINNYKKFYMKRIVTVSFPAILVSLLTIITLIIAGVSVSVTTIIAYCVDLEGLLFLNWTFVSQFFNQIDSLGPLWFTTIIMLCYLLVPLLQALYKRYLPRNINVLLFIVIGITISIIVKPYFELSYFLFYIVGYIAGKNNLMKKINTKWFAIYSFVFCAVIVIRLVLHRYYDDTDIYFTYVGVSHFVLGTWFVVLYAWLNNRIGTNMEKVSGNMIVKVLDKYSYYIFLVYGVFCMGTFNLFELMPLHFATFAFVGLTVFFAIIIKAISNLLTKPFIKRLVINAK